jgi:hypothetical protein
MKLKTITKITKEQRKKSRNPKNEDHIREYNI